MVALRFSHLLSAIGILGTGLISGKCLLLCVCGVRQCMMNQKVLSTPGVTEFFATQSLWQAGEAHSFVRRRGSHIF
jgi:hypothetical protein